jgi:hypothetical protein
MNITNNENNLYYPYTATAYFIYIIFNGTREETFFNFFLKEHVVFFFFSETYVRFDYY